MKCKLGQLIEQVERRNSELEFGADAVRGISNTKQIQMTKADISNRSFKKFQIVKDREFVYNRRTTRMGEKIGLGFNDVGYDFIVTEDYTVFKVKDYRCYYLSICSFSLIGQNLIGILDGIHGEVQLNSLTGQK